MNIVKVSATHENFSELPLTPDAVVSSDDP